MGGQPAIHKIKKNYNLIIVSLLVVFYLFNGIQYLQCQSITSDEGPYYNYAKRFITGHPEKAGSMIDDSKMPVIVLNLIPRVIQQWARPGLKKNDQGESDIIMGRYVTLFISVLTVLLVYKWARQLYGSAAGLFAAFLMVFCPNNLASAGLVTTDSYSVLALLAVMYSTWKFCVTKNKRYFFLLCCAVAIAQLVKQTLFHLYILVPLCIAVYHVIKKLPFKIGALFKYTAVFIFINWLVINAGYYFYQTNTALGSYHFVSGPFQLLQHIFPSLLPVPLPKPFVDGLDMVKHNNDVGGGYASSTFGKVTILGHASTGGSFWYYYIVSLFFKTPISYFAFIAWALWLIIKRHSLKSWMGREFF